MTVLLRNNADTVLATALGSADLGMTVTQGGRFPTPAANEYFYATITALTGLFEVVKVTARSGNTMTIVRAQEGTAALDFIVGSRVELRVTAQAIRDAISDSAVDVDAYFEADGTGTSVGLNVGSGKVLAVGGTLNASTGAIVLPQSASPSVTAEGSIAWDTNDDRLVVGTGSGSKTVVDTNSTQTLTNKTLTSPVVTGGTINNAAIGGTTPAAGAFTTLAASGAVGFLPTGIICMWYGSVATIPTGWTLCNGSNGTPDLRDRFVIGARQDDGTTAKTNVTGALTQTGGSKDAIVVSHTHTATVTDPGHTHTTTINGSGLGHSQGGAANPLTASVPTSSPITANYTSQSSVTGISVANASTGSSGTNANLVPYYALCYIMRL